MQKILENGYKDFWGSFKKMQLHETKSVKCILPTSQGVGGLYFESPSKSPFYYCILNKLAHYLKYCVKHDCAYYLSKVFFDIK